MLGLTYINKSKLISSEIPFDSDFIKCQLVLHEKIFNLVLHRNLFKNINWLSIEFYGISLCLLYLFST